MVERISRTEKHIALIEKFLDDDSASSMELKLYRSEPERLEKAFPGQIQIGQGTFFKGKLFNYTVTKK